MKTSYKAWYTLMLNNIHLHKNQNIQHFKNFMSFHFKNHFSSKIKAAKEKREKFQKICLEKITDKMSSSKIQQCSKLKITVTFKKPFSGM